MLGDVGEGVAALALTLVMGVCVVGQFTKKPDEVLLVLARPLQEVPERSQVFEPDVVPALHQDLHHLRVHLSAVLGELVVLGMNVGHDREQHGPAGLRPKRGRLNSAVEPVRTG